MLPPCQLLRFLHDIERSFFFRQNISREQAIFDISTKYQALQEVLRIQHNEFGINLQKQEERYEDLMRSHVKLQKNWEETTRILEMVLGLLLRTVCFHETNPQCIFLSSKDQQSLPTTRRARSKVDRIQKGGSYPHKEARKPSPPFKSQGRAKKCTSPKGNITYHP